MITTSPSLLDRLQRPSQTEAWTRFVRLYSPVLYTWARRMGLHPHDAADLVQDVFTILVRKLPEFEYDRTGRFRGWLWTVTHNCWRDRFRRRPLPIDPASPLDQLPEDDPTAAIDELEFSRHVVRAIVPSVQAEFRDSTWRAFWEHVVEDRPAAEVARELGVTTAAVYKAKVRILSRLNRELDHLGEDRT